jgi:hypothetical protein
LQKTGDAHILVSRTLIDELAPANDNLRKAMLLMRARRGMVTRYSAEALLSRTDDTSLKHLSQFFYDEEICVTPTQSGMQCWHTGELNRILYLRL